MQVYVETRKSIALLHLRWMKQEKLLLELLQCQKVQLYSTYVNWSDDAVNCSDFNGVDDGKWINMKQWWDNTSRLSTTNPT